MIPIAELKSRPRPEPEGIGEDEAETAINQLADAIYRAGINQADTVTLPLELACDLLELAETGFAAMSEEG